LKVLIVDDNQDYAEGLADILEAKGHAPHIATSGPEALERIRGEDYDVTFLDVKMSGMNGVEALSAMLEIKPDAKVVMMTAYSVESLLEEAQRAGARAVLRKPLNMDDVFRLIENLPDRIILGG
jgi:CheY-like chemotaxis protein